ncbi:hypothetical protein POM88_048244 [Heracleum sosnowskyi]|uniref:Uncharacterized protein n=1 Tax=Heracleum sosnowskyi TaxID=360622 RepID=A0AAD8GVV3_9APIA|nr:hypothetical protein POM88_048244 [Heracleum sosnowskyi]
MILQNGCLNELSGGFVRMRNISSVKAACSGSYKSPNQLCSLAIRTKEYPKSSFYKVKVARKVGSGLYALMPRTSYVKKGMEVVTQDEEEFADIKEGDIINLTDLIFSEDRDYLIRYNDQKVKPKQLVGKAILVYFLPVSRYPFTDERIKFLDSEDDAAINQPSLELLLGSPDRDYLITNNGDKVPIHTLKNKSTRRWVGVSVISICWEEAHYIFRDAQDPSSYNKPDVSYLVPDYGELPWPVHYYGEGYSLPKELEHSVLDYHYYTRIMRFQRCLLIAFDRDGSIVRKTFHPTFDDKVFPFYAGGLEKEFLYQLDISFGWFYWNDLSKKKNPIYRRAE